MIIKFLNNLKKDKNLKNKIIINENIFFKNKIDNILNIFNKNNSNENFISKKNEDNLNKLFILDENKKNNENNYFLENIKKIEDFLNTEEIKIYLFNKKELSYEEEISFNKLKNNYDIINTCAKYNTPHLVKYFLKFYKNGYICNNNTIKKFKENWFLDKLWKDEIYLYEKIEYIILNHFLKKEEVIKKLDDNEYFKNIFDKNKKENESLYFYSEIELEIKKYLYWEKIISYEEEEKFKKILKKPKIKQIIEECINYEVPHLIKYFLKIKENWEYIYISDYNNKWYLKKLWKDEKFLHEKIQYIIFKNLNNHSLEDEILKKLEDDEYFEKIFNKNQIIWYDTKLNLKNIEINDKNTSNIKKLIDLESKLWTWINKFIEYYGNDKLDLLLEILEKITISDLRDWLIHIFIYQFRDNRILDYNYFFENIRNQNDFYPTRNILLNINKNNNNNLILKNENIDKAKNIINIFNKNNIPTDYLNIDLEIFFKIDLNNLDILLNKLNSSKYNLYYKNYDIWKIIKSILNINTSKSIEILDNNINKYFSNRLARTEILLNLIFDKYYENDQSFEKNLIEKIKLLEKPEKNLEKYIEVMIKYLNTSLEYHEFEKIKEKFDRESFLNSLEIDKELTILNTGFFMIKRDIKRSDCKSWQDFIKKNISNNTEKNKEYIIKTFENIAWNWINIEERLMLKETQNYSWTINMNRTNLENIIRSGEIKSSWELKKEDKWKLEDKAWWKLNFKKYEKNRDNIESKMWYSTDIEENIMEHVIYWWLVTESSLKTIDIDWAAPWYARWEWNIFLKIKKEKIDKDWLFCIDDSFYDFFSRRWIKNWLGVEWIFTSQVDINWALIAKIYQEYTAKTPDWRIRGNGDYFNYVEMHLLNGVKMEDIESIHIQEEDDFNYFINNYPELKNKFIKIDI